MATLKCENFILKIDHKDNKVNINVSNDSYSACTQIDCWKEEFVKFVTKLDFLYSSLKEGEANLTDDEYYWSNEYYTIKFQSDGLGHFIIYGHVTTDYFNCQLNESWNLKFRKTIDQTFLKSFISELKREINN